MAVKAIQLTEQMNEQTGIKDIRDLQAEMLQALGVRCNTTAIAAFPNVESQNAVNRTAFIGWPLNLGSP
jgi:hypothetical protein